MVWVAHGLLSTHCLKSLMRNGNVCFCNWLALSVIIVLFMGIDWNQWLGLSESISVNLTTVVFVWKIYIIKYHQ